MSNGRSVRRLAILTVGVCTVLSSLLVQLPANAANLPDGGPSGISGSSGPSITAAPPSGLNDEILRWTFYVQDVIRRVGGGPTTLSRSAAMTFLATYDAVNSVTPVGQPYRRQLPDGPRCAALSTTERDRCLKAAVNWAAATVLEQVHPSQASFVQSARNTEDARIGTGLGYDIGRSIGGQAAQELLNARANDGAQNNTAYVFDNVPGAWRLTPVACPAPVTPFSDT